MPLDELVVGEDMGAREEHRLRIRKSKGLRLRVNNPGGRGGNRTHDQGLV
jgi:hypothetical protein